MPKLIPDLDEAEQQNAQIEIALKTIRRRRRALFAAVLGLPLSLLNIPYALSTRDLRFDASYASTIVAEP